MDGQRSDLQSLVKFIEHLDMKSSKGNWAGVQNHSNRLIHQLIEPSGSANGASGFDYLLERILHTAMVITRTESGFISIRNLNNKIEFKVGRNKLNTLLNVKDFVIDRDLISQSIRNEMPLHHSYNSDSPLYSGNPQHVLVAPLFLHSDLVGLLHLQSFKPILPTTHIKWHVFKIFLSNASLAIRNGQFNKLAHDYQVEKENLQNSLIQSDNLAMKGRMAAKVGHELNNFLSGIHANIEMAADLVNSKAKRHNIIDRMEKAQEMIMNMSALSNSLMSKEGLEANIEKSSLNKVVNKFVDFVTPVYKCSNVSIDTELDRHIPDAAIDSGLMIQVLFNIVKNAVEAKPDTRILLKTCYDKHARQVFLEIHDNGPGIPQNKQEKIFKPLYTDKSNGHGYGLAICWDIVNKHNGTIRVVSSVGEGTTFIISLPFDVGQDYAQVELDMLERLEEKRSSSLKNSIKAPRKKTINPPFRPLSNYS